MARRVAASKRSSIVMEVLLWLLVESRELHQPKERVVDQPAPKPHGPVEIEEENDAFFRRVIPHLVFVGIVKDKDFAGAPDIDGVADPHAAFLRFPGDDQAEMGPHNSLADAAMGGDVVAGT